MKIISWNVNGIRAAVKKGFIDYVHASKADIFCVQETKAQDDQVLTALEQLTDYNIYSNSAERKGYSGVAIFTKNSPREIVPDMGVEEHDNEGRVLCLDYEQFYLVNVYVPNSGAGLRRLDYRAEWDRDFADYLNKLRKEKMTIVTGDFNVAHQPIDLARPESNYNKTSGYTQVEIDGFSNILDQGFTDVFRHLYPERVQYTFWSMRLGARARNIGWRLDYFLVNDADREMVIDAPVYDKIMGSDHCPLGLELKPD